jgi:hypothetical protein
MEFAFVLVEAVDSTRHLSYEAFRSHADLEFLRVTPQPWVWVDQSQILLIVRIPLETSARTSFLGLETTYDPRHKKEG